MHLPENFEIQMQTLLQAEYPAFLKSYTEQPYTGLRANTLKISPQALKKTLGLPLRAVPWCGEGFYDEGDTRLSKNPFFHAGLYYLQEPSAMCPASVLNPMPGERVLDLCAAPGGKSTQMAAKLNGRGFLIANDISASRCKALLKNLNLMGVTNSLVTCEAPEKLARVFTGYFDKVLVDAPCSGEGMFRKDPDMAKHWQKRSENPYPAIQQSILRHAANMLAPNGRLVYATCTFTTQENEEIIQQFLDENKCFTVVPLGHAALGIAPGFALDGDTRLTGCGRIMPHKQDGEGHFFALLQRNDDETPLTITQPAQTSIASKDALAPFNEFCNDFLSSPLDGNFFICNQSLFLQPNGLPDLSGTRMMSSGFYIGSLNHNRFAPSQTFAMGLKREQVANTITFYRDDRRLYRYLSGETLEVEAKNGWHLVCVEQFPLGFGKVQNGRMKNKYDKSWMIK